MIDHVVAKAVHRHHHQLELPVGTPPEIDADPLRTPLLGVGLRQKIIEHIRRELLAVTEPQRIEHLRSQMIVTVESSLEALRILYRQTDRNNVVPQRIFIDGGLPMISITLLRPTAGDTCKK